MRRLLLLTALASCGAKSEPAKPVVVAPQSPLDAAVRPDIIVEDDPDPEPEPPRNPFQPIADGFEGTGLPNNPALSADRSTAVLCAAAGNGMASWFALTCFIFKSTAKPEIVTVMDVPTAISLMDGDDDAATAVTGRARKVSARLGTGTIPLVAVCRLRPAADDCELGGVSWSITETGELTVGARKVRFAQPANRKPGCGYEVIAAPIWTDEPATFALVDVKWGNRSDACGVDSIDDVRRMPPR
jgi:hypothetical protein